MYPPKNECRECGAPPGSSCKGPVTHLSRLADAMQEITTSAELATRRA